MNKLGIFNITRADVYIKNLTIYEIFLSTYNLTDLLIF